MNGKKAYLTAGFLGLLSAAALPPIHLLLLVIPSFSGLFILLNQASTKKRAFWLGWWWGLGYFTAGLYWICISLYVEPEKFAWLTPFALFGLPSILGIYTGLVCLLSCRLQVVGYKKVIFFAAIFTLSEYLRSHLFSGFAWNLIGYVTTISSTTMQLAYYISIYGLCFIVVLIATMPALAITDKNQALKPNIITFIFAISVILFGLIRLENNPTLYSKVKIRIVQPNIEQSLKWNEQTRFAGFKKHIYMSGKPGIEDINLVIWPEAAIPYYIDEIEPLLKESVAFLPEKSLLIAGGLRGQESTEKPQAFNSLFAIDKQGKIVSTYDKRHLVPFGEYIPFRNILPLENIAGGIGDFASGSGIKTQFIGDYPPFLPIICYEAIFSEESNDSTKQAKWILNVTNDAWFGISSGPYQHLQMARMRAVEQGLPLVRAANTGISAIIDPLGRIIAKTELGKEAILDGYVPESDLH
ncbi:MAG: apolipoprotein N-acyltransferase [Pseudomonadota bacterium]